MDEKPILNGDYFCNSRNDIFQVIKYDEFNSTYTLRYKDKDVCFDATREVIFREFKRCDEYGNKLNNNLKNKNMEKKNQLQEIEINHEAGSAVLISPKMLGKMALVDLGTLKRIISGLSQASFEHIRETFVEKIKNTTELQQLVDVTKDEINFHESVNIIKTIELDENVIESKH